MKKFTNEWTDRDKTGFFACSQALFGSPEPGMQEFKTLNLLTGLAERHGSAMERGVVGMPAAFVAASGKGAAGHAAY